MKTVTGIVKKLAVFCMAFMMACMPAAAYASETGTGDTVTTCNVAFAVADKTASGYPGTSITVEMRDVTGTYDENYTLTQAASWGTGNTPIYTVPAPTTYNVTVSGLEDGYSVVGSDGSSEIRFAAASYGEVTLSLSIVDAGSTAQQEETDTGENTSSIGDAANSDMPDGAEEVFQNFLDATAYIADEKEWQDNFLIKYQLFSSTYCEWYVTYVADATEAEWEEMSLYDRFVWSESYLHFAHASDIGDYDEYYSCEEKFEENLTSYITDLMDYIDGHEEAEKAYLELAAWQYNYVNENGVPYNFINARSYIEELAAADVKEEAGVIQEEEAVTEEAEDELSAEPEEDADEDIVSEEEEEGIWHDTLEKISKSFVSFIVIAVLGIAIAIIIWKRKKLNIEDDQDGGSGIEQTKEE
ncbi:MAG: hypothetical protein LUC32_07735 [Clostridiales bacterium]|nr:hypothetical protein [Clostridiales bacterium]